MIAPMVVTFSPSFLVMVLFLIPALCRSTNNVPDVLSQLFGLAHGDGDVGVEETDSVNRCALHT